ncbi:siphovirus Gp157 family protein [Polaromonas sp. YR568]|uniref:siphovirus Gp157 family protein n=1 Tax=Polaromonas sp. YR568 TaxID=1855301 RepID=UPI00313838CA
MTALYVLTNQYLALAEQLADGDFDATTIADTIEASGITDELAVKAQGIEFVARGAEAHNAAIDAEIARLASLKLSRQKVADGLRAYLKDNMERAGIEKIECPLFKLSIKKNPPAVEIIDPLSLPKEFWRTPEPKPPVAAPDKARIKEALQHGDDVPGAKLVQGTRLDVK